MTRFKDLLPVILLLSLVWPGRSTWACEPHPDYWFRETVEFAKVSLPEGFTVYQPGTPIAQPPPQGIWVSAGDPGREYRTVIALVNQTAEPLYVLSLRYRDVLVMATPDPPYEQRLGMAHEVASYLAVAGTRQMLSLPMEALLDLDPALQDPNIWSLNPPDPAAPIPHAQSSELLIVYKGQVILLPFRITYRLNEAFDTGQCEEMWASANAAAAVQAAATQQVIRAEQTRQANTLVFGLLALALTGVLFWIFARLLRRQNPEQ